MVLRCRHGRHDDVVGCGCVVVQEPEDAVVRNGSHGCLSVAVVCAVQDGSRGPGTQANLQHHLQTDKTHRCIFFSPEAGDKRDKRPSRGQEGQKDQEWTRTH